MFQSSGTGRRQIDEDPAPAAFVWTYEEAPGRTAGTVETTDVDLGPARRSP
jgi:hypothetical protein